MKKKIIQCGLVACLVLAAMLIAVAAPLPKADEANRATRQIMKQVKIPPPYTPVYQPPTWQQYVPPARFTPVTPSYSPKVIPAALPLASAFPAVEPPIAIAATNVTRLPVANVPALDKADKISVPAAAPGK